jgi:DNA-binding MarR family transcriptional regulator
VKAEKIGGQIGGFGEQQQEVLAWLFLSSFLTPLLDVEPDANFLRASIVEWEPDRLLPDNPTPSHRNSLSTTLRSLEQRKTLVRYRARISDTSARQRTAYVSLTRRGYKIAENIYNSLDKTKKLELEQKVRSNSQSQGAVALLTSLMRGMSVLAQDPSLEEWERKIWQGEAEQFEEVIGLLKNKGY